MGFEYVKANTEEEALDSLQRHEHAMLIAGGTNILVDIRAEKIKNGYFVDIADMKSLQGINVSDTETSIGATTLIADLLCSDELAYSAPALHMACRHLADPVIRNKATIGGNIAYASPCADTVPALLALDASIHVLTPRGEKIIPLETFFLDYYVTALKSSDLITRIVFKNNRKSGFYKLGLRNAMAISIASAAVAVELSDNGTIEVCRIAMGSVAPYPIRAYNAEALLVGRKFDRDMFSGMDAAIKSDIRPITDVRATEYYRYNVSPEVVKRAFQSILL